MKKDTQDAAEPQVKVLAKAFALIWRENPVRMSLVILVALVDGFIPVLNLLLMKGIIDAMTGATELAGNPLGFTALVASWFAVMVAQYSVSSLSAYLIEVTGDNSCRKLSLRIMDKSLSFAGIARFEDKGYHELSQWINFVDAPVVSYVYQASDIIKFSVQFASVFAVFALLDLWVPVALVLSIVPGILSARKRAAAKSEQQETVNAIERRVSYYRGRTVSASASKEFRLFSFDSLFRKKNGELFDRMLKIKTDYNSKAFRLELFSTAFRVLVVGAVFLLLAARARDGSLGAGSLALFLQAIFQFSSSLLQIVTVYSYTRTAYDFFWRLFRFLGMEDSLDLSRSVRRLDGPLRELRFENVTFSYPSGALVLDGVSFTLKAGDSLAIVGENGAGKTTLVKLMSRLYDPGSGAIYANGVDLRELDPRLYREKLSAIFQDYNKYELSLAENVFADGQKTPLARADLPKLLPEDFYASLPEGDDTLLGTEFGSRELSGGQWQRIAILRGLAKPHDLFLVDEPTASIDPIEEANVFKAILERKSAMTVLVTHRLGSIKQATRILVLKAGRVVAEGEHADLLANSVYYAELYSSQADLYKPD